jgi:hypothetical protein
MEVDCYKQIAPRDVIGFHVFNTNSGMGAGYVTGMDKNHGVSYFVCETASGGTVHRKVDSIMNDLRHHGWSLCHEPWQVAIEDSIGYSDDDEQEIKDRANESWDRLATEFGLTEEEVEDIILG